MYVERKETIRIAGTLRQNFSFEVRRFVVVSFIYVVFFIVHVCMYVCTLVCYLADGVHNINASYSRVVIYELVYNLRLVIIIYYGFFPR